MYYIHILSFNVHLIRPFSFYDKIPLKSKAMNISNAMHAKSLQSYLTLWDSGQQPTRLLCPRNSPGRNNGVGCQSLLQGIFPNQRSNPGLGLCRQFLCRLSHQGSPVNGFALPPPHEKLKCSPTSRSLHWLFLFSGIDFPQVPSFQNGGNQYDNACKVLAGTWN